MSSARPHWSVHRDSRAQANFREWKLTSSGTSTWHVSFKHRDLARLCSWGGTTVDRMGRATSRPTLETWSDLMVFNFGTYGCNRMWLYLCALCTAWPFSLKNILMCFGSTLAKTSVTFWFIYRSCCRFGHKDNFLRCTKWLLMLCFIQDILGQIFYISIVLAYIKPPTLIPTSTPLYSVYLLNQFYPKLSKNQYLIFFLVKKK